MSRYILATGKFPQPATGRVCPMELRQLAEERLGLTLDTGAHPMRLFVREKEFYIKGAMKLLRAADEKYCNWNPQEDSIVAMGSGSYFTEHDRHVPIIYGDYYLIEAVLRLMEKDILLW